MAELLAKTELTALQVPNLQTTEPQDVQGHSTDVVPSVEVSIIQRTGAIVRGLFEVLSHHDCPSEILSALGEQVHNSLDSLESEVVWLKHAKHMLAAPLAIYLKNEPPVCPEGFRDFTGKVKRWLRSRYIFNRRNTHLWNSWLQVKRSALPVSDDFVEKVYADHFVSLTKKDLGSPKVIDDIMSDHNFLSVLDVVRNKVTKHFGKKHFSSFAPSSNACFEKSRSEGGSLEYLRETLLARSSTGRQGNSVKIEIRSPEFHSMKCYPILRRRCRLDYNVVVNVMSQSFYWDDLRVMLREEECHTEALRCTIQAVLEPMKVRVISKGESLPYYAMKPLQKIMHSALKKIPCFRLIGRPLDVTDLIDLNTSSSEPRYYDDESLSSDDIDPQCFEEEEWFSIDYSAATDDLSWLYSGRILRYIISGLSEDEQGLALRVLGPHDLYYPTRDGPKRFRGRQRNGQLMGSILSFPILCLANFGVYLQTMRDLHLSHHWSYKQIISRVIINGDDMLYRAPKSKWEEHISVGKSVGLNMTVGKAYHHRSYANVNSTSFHYDIGKEKSVPHRIDFLNVGLLFGQHKVLGSSDEGCQIAADHHMPTTYTACWEQIRMGALPGRQTRLLKRYLNLNLAAISRECLISSPIGKEFFPSDGISLKARTRNLFVPIHLGGMGWKVPTDGSWKFKLTLNDRLAANVYAAGHLIEGIGPSQGFPLNSLSPLSTPWIKTPTGIFEDVKEESFDLHTLKYFWELYHLGKPKGSRVLLPGRYLRHGCQFYSCNRSTFC
jgi:hypothetical protein